MSSHAERCPECGAAWAPDAPSRGLTRRQKEIWSWIADYVSRTGRSPSFQEIAEGIGVTSSATVSEHIDALEKKGVVKRGGYNRARSLQVLQEPPGGGS